MIWGSVFFPNVGVVASCLFNYIGLLGHYLWCGKLIWGHLQQGFCTSIGVDVIVYRR